MSSPPNYAPAVCQPAVETLGLKSADDAFVLNIVSISPRGDATVNLRGPLVINRHTLVGKQCVPANVSTFNQQHPLQTNRAAAA